MAADAASGGAKYGATPSNDKFDVIKLILSILKVGLRTLTISESF